MIKSRIYSWQTSPNIIQQKFRFAPNSTPTRTQTRNRPKQAPKPDHSIPQTHLCMSLTYRSTLGFSSPHRPHTRPKPGTKNSFTTLPRRLLMGSQHIVQLLPRLVQMRKLVPQVSREQAPFSHRFLHDVYINDTVLEGCKYSALTTAAVDLSSGLL